MFSFAAMFFSPSNGLCSVVDFTLSTPDLRLVPPGLQLKLS